MHQTIFIYFYLHILFAPHLSLGMSWTISAEVTMLTLTTTLLSLKITSGSSSAVASGNRVGITT